VVHGLCEIAFRPDVVVSWTIIHQMHHVPRSVPTGTVVSFRWEIFPEAGGVVGEETVSDRKAEEGGGGMS
jgi:hypothetical protein